MILCYIYFQDVKFIVNQTSNKEFKDIFIDAFKIFLQLLKIVTKTIS